MHFEEEKIIEVINKAWNWAVPKVKEILAVNSMGNVFLKDSEGKYWRICPEELTATLEAKNNDEVEIVFNNPEYKEDWQLLGLIDEAESHFGKIEVGECYAFIKPAVIGGDYSVKNMRVASIYEYLSFTGDIAFQTKDLKQGDEVNICFTP